MPFTYNGKEVEKVTYNGKEVQKIEYNGTTVWEAGQWYPVQIEILTSPEYTYENVAPFDHEFSPVTNDTFPFQYMDTSIQYYRTSPKKYRISGSLTYYNYGTIKTVTFTDVIIDPAIDGGVVTTFDYGRLELVIGSGGSIQFHGADLSTTKYMTKLEITKFDEYR